MRHLAPYLWIGVAVCVIGGLLVGAAYQQEASYSKYDVKGKGDATSLEPEKSSGTGASEDGNESEDQETLVHQTSEPTHSSHSRHINESRSETVLLARADAAIHEARYENAVTILQEMCDAQGANASARTRLKLAACRETLGQQNAALTNYQNAAERTRIEPVQTAAKLGLARIWTNTDKAEMARNELLRSLLTHQKIRSRPVESRLLHQLGQAAAESLLTDSEKTTPLSDAALEIPREEIAAEEVLDELVLSPEVNHDPKASQNPVRSVLKLDDSAETILLEVSTPALPVLKLLEQLAQETKLQLNFDGKTTDILKNRVVAMDLQGVPLSILLDAILTPLNCDWQQAGTVITVNQKTQSTPNQAQAQAERLLRFAMSTAPDHSLAPFSQAALASLEQRAGKTDAAIRGLRRTLELFPEFNHPDDIWMNIGKCQLKTNNANALDAFHKAADLGDRTSTGAAAYAYIGRIHLQNNEPHQAIAPLRFAVEQARAGKLQLEARLLLASAYLMSGQFPETRKSLEACLIDPNSGTKRNEIALLAGLLEHHTQRSHLQRERDDAKLLTAANHVNCKTAFGEHWWYLKCVAYHELGFHEEAVRLSKQFQTVHQGLPIELKTRELVQSTAAVRFGEEVASSKEPLSPVQQFAKWLPFDAQTIKSGSANDILTLCHNMLANPKTSKVERLQTLRLMGTIYQQRGDHEMAVKCFTDNLTAEETDGAD